MLSEVVVLLYIIACMALLNYRHCSMCHELRRQPMNYSVPHSLLINGHNEAYLTSLLAAVSQRSVTGQQTESSQCIKHSNNGV